ncbi:C-Myc-binding protein [Carassius auratus]|uniref:c-Myc-binding protein n=1 Tax=Carassius auratus TaxID=7957 RepID=A0A6P6LX92_CARAU|nr:c-Myc-binding protein-like [Carassius auratus]XP_052388853.1 C-Myc-binding protein [Carassius gibelio]
MRAEDSFVMAHYRAPESKREQFRRYLEKNGVLDTLTNVLVTLYEETEKPSNALDFIKHQLGVGPQDDEAESLRLELTRLRQKYDQLMEENTDLRSRLLRYEPAQDVATE